MFQRLYFTCYRLGRIFRCNDNAFLRIVSPSSYFSFTKWIVIPLSFSPAAITASCAKCPYIPFPPNFVPSRAGWIFDNAVEDLLPTRLVGIFHKNPASTTRSIFCSFNNRMYLSEWRKASFSITILVIPSRSAICKTPAPGLLHTITVTWPYRLFEMIYNFLRVASCTRCEYGNIFQNLLLFE